MSGDDAVQDFAEALRHELDEEIGTSPMVADLADVFARARAMDGEIPPGLHPDHEPSGAEAAGEETSGGPGDDRGLDLDLGRFAAAMRQEVEAEIEDTRHQRPRPRRPLVAVAKVMAVAAALLVVFVSLPRLMPLIAERGTTPVPVVEPHVHAADTDGSELEAHQRAPRPTQRTIDPRPTVVPHAEEFPEPEPQPAEVIEPPTRPRPRASLDELEARASAQWSAGQLGAAEATLRKVIARTGRTERAELAFGDLFAIARQRGGSAAQARAWREYLRMFPKGRYADDARGGLCRRVDEARRSACWADYLESHPAGAHAAEARRVREGDNK